MDGASDEPLNKDYYKVLEVDYDASDDTIKLNYRRLALMWHPDKLKADNDVTAKFQEINEAYTVLSDPVKRLEYDFSGCYEINQYTLREYLTRFKGMILTCNGLGMDNLSKWTAGTVARSRHCSGRVTVATHAKQSSSTGSALQCSSVLQCAAVFLFVRRIRSGGNRCQTGPICMLGDDCSMVLFFISKVQHLMELDPH